MGPKGRVVDVLEEEVAGGVEELRRLRRIWEIVRSMLLLVTRLMSRTCCPHPSVVPRPLLRRDQ